MLHCVDGWIVCWISKWLDGWMDVTQMRMSLVPQWFLSLIVSEFFLNTVNTGLLIMDKFQLKN